MSTLSFVLALGALVWPIIWLVSALGLPLLAARRALSPSGRVELTTALLLAPALLTLTLLVTIAAPSVLALIDPSRDHCLGHGHHLHLCLWHGATLPPWLAWIGAAMWTVTGARLTHAALKLVETERLGAALSALGHTNDAVCVVPSSRGLCHAVGLLRPRVLVSKAVVERLAPDELAAALAHERAHLAHGDPRWSAALSLAAALSPCSAPLLAAWRDAVEDAADDAAASLCGGEAVSRALIAVARLRLAPAPGLGLVQPQSLERRVMRLLAPRPTPRGSRALWGALALVTLTGLGIGWGHEGLHHAAEELWSALVLS